jgi:hypothetical protein
MSRNCRVPVSARWRTAHERPVLLGREPDLRGELQGLLGGLPIGGEVVLAAEVVVVHPGDVGGAQVDLAWFSGLVRHDVPPVRSLTDRT